MKIKALILLLSLFIWVNSFGQKAPLSGLYFSSHEVIKDQRTSLNLTPEKAFDLSKGFTLEFEANFRQGDGYYGYIFRMIGDHKTNIDLVSNLASTTVNFWLVLQDNILISYKWEDIPDGGYDKWIKVRFQIDPELSQISLSLNDETQVAHIDSLAFLSHMNVVFGACNYPYFLNSDVSPMSLRDIRLITEKKKLNRHWTLARHGAGNVYDEIANARAEALNPIWLIDRHIRWRHRKTIQFDNLTGIAWNENSGDIYCVGEQQLYVQNISNNKLDTLSYVEGKPYYCELDNQVIYNPYTEELWSYNFDDNHISKFDFTTRKWSLTNPDCPEPDFGHHNKLISPLDSSLVTFGGYGHYSYKSVVNEYDQESGEWQQYDLSKSIYPRYLSSLGLMSKSKALIFGGYGSKSGRQELSPEFYYDLFTLDLNDFTTKKLWKTENSSSFVPCTNLIYDPDSGKFLTLLYNSSHFETTLRLASFNLDNPGKELLADSIPYEFLDIKSKCYLFLNKSTNELITATVHDSKMNIYSLAYPPLLSNEVYQTEAVNNSKTRFWVLLALIIIAAGSIVVFLIKRKTRKRVSADESSDTFRFDPEYNQENQGQKQKVSSLYLFGGFQVFDKTGNDITAGFTPTLKELFLIIFLHSLKNGKGVSSQTLNEALWHDKTEESARNNRNVNMSKLRPLLEEIGNIDLSNENTFWKISAGGETYCDYVEIMYLLKKMNQPSEPNENDILRVLSIASSGGLLSDVQNEWVDVFKADFSNLLIDALISASKQTTNLNLLYNISECILKYDTVNDDAIAIKCTALCKLGKKGLAKHAYDTFCQEYKNLMGTDFEASFKELLAH